MVQDPARFKRGSFGRVWGDDFKYLNYTRQPITPYEIEIWRSQGYDYVKSFTGTMYDNRNPMPKWVKRLENAFGLYNQTYTFYKMDTLEIMPTHSDHFKTYQKLYNTDISKIWRALLMLEDWKPGHYLEINGEAFVNWKAGDWFAWQGDYPHAAANIGVEPRYTLQVTGMTVYTGLIEGLVHYNVPDMLPSPSSSHPHVKSLIHPNLYKVNESIGNMIYFSNGKIKELNNVSHDESNSLHLNSLGLHIWLYEPICSYEKNQDNQIKHTEGFYSEFTGKENIEDLRAEELDSILDYATRNNLTNVTVHTGEYDIAKYYPHYNKLNLVTDDLFLKTIKRVENLDTTFNESFRRRFVSLNWRYTKHRHIISTYLANKSANLSWNFKAPFKILEEINWLNLSDIKNSYPDIYKTLQENNQYINKYGPFNVDLTSREPVWITDSGFKNIWPSTKEYNSGETPALHNFSKNPLQDAYKDSFLDVVTESRYAQHAGNISEKVLQAIQFKKPFILVAPPKSLEYLKTFGFKTFSDFWDESYDDEFDHGVRMIKILRLIDQINNMPLDELRQMYAKMKLIVEFNFNTFERVFSNPKYTV